MWLNLAWDGLGPSCSTLISLNWNLIDSHWFGFGYGGYLILTNIWIVNDIDFNISIVSDIDFNIEIYFNIENNFGIANSVSEF